MEPDENNDLRIIGKIEVGLVKVEVKQTKNSDYVSGSYVCYQQHKHVL